MAALPHRNVSNIRPSITGIHSPNPGGSGSPHTPVRTISSNFASPSTLRAEEDYIIIKLGSRSLHAGFAGDVLPKAVISFGPEEQRRAGDYRKWKVGHNVDWRKRSHGKEWEEDYELWKLDLRSVDLGLVGDKIERALREAITKYLFIDSRPRRMALVLPSLLPLPLLSTILDSIFNNFQPPTISLLSAPLLTTIAAGLRAALVVDIGWTETVVTAIYEYREVLCRRTIRASKLLGKEMLKLLSNAVLSLTQQSSNQSSDSDEAKYRKIISFEECEEIVARIAWCRPSNTKLATFNVSEADKDKHEVEASTQDLNGSHENPISILLSSTQPPVTLKLPFSDLSEPCENALFADGIKMNDLDDEELPLHFVVFQTLLHLPVDVRSICISRIIFTGGVSNMPGLKNRIMREVGDLVRKSGWDPVQGQAAENFRLNNSLQTHRSDRDSSGPTEIAAYEKDLLKSSTNLAFNDLEANPYEEKLQRDLNKGTRPSIQGILRSVESLGPWSGASLISQLKVPAVSVVEREQWIQQGILGASKPGDSMSSDQRQSMGPGVLRPGQVERVNWTLGPWG